MFTSKKYVKAVNAKGIFDNTYEARIEQTELSQKFLSTLGVNYADDEVSMPKGYLKRKKELAIWLKSYQDREVEKTEYSKRKKAEKKTKSPACARDFCCLSAGGRR